MPHTVLARRLQSHLVTPARLELAHGHGTGNLHASTSPQKFGETSRAVRHADNSAGPIPGLMCHVVSPVESAASGTGLDRRRIRWCWRWRRDLNPRTVLAVSRFQGECIRPLCHATVGKPSGSARRPIPRRVRRRREAPLRPPRPPCGSSRRWRPAVAVSGASDSAHARTRSTSASPPRPACGPAR